MNDLPTLESIIGPSRETLPTMPVPPPAELAPRPPTPIARRATRGNVHPAERVASVVAGAALVALAVRRRSAAGVALGLAGAPLLFRGLSGYCPVYGAAGLSTAQAPASPEPFVVTRAITIGRTAAEVRRFLADPHNLAPLFERFAEVAPEGDGLARWTLRGPGKLEARWATRAEDVGDPDALRWRVEDGGAPAEATVRMRPAPGSRGTEVELSLRVDLPGGSLVGAAARRFRVVPGTAALRALQRLKSLVETGEAPTLAHNPSARREGEG